MIHATPVLVFILQNFIDLCPILTFVPQEVLRVSREFKCCACGCCWCADIDGCSHHVTVEAPVGQVIGYVKHRYSVSDCLVLAH